MSDELDLIVAVLRGYPDSLAKTDAMRAAGVIRAKVEALRQELETERMRLAACGVVALADTPESAAKARDMLPQYRSASCDDVARRVDECMNLRGQVEALRKVLDQLQNGVLLDAFNHDDNGLPVLVQRSNDSYIKAQLQKFERLIDAALAARPGEKP